MLKIAIEYDDAGVSNPAMLAAWERLQSIKEHFPNFKVTLFLVPWEIRFGKPKSIVNPDFKVWLETLKKAQDDGWVRYALHGLTHLPKEFAELDYANAHKRIKAGRDICKLGGLDLLPIFKAPNWLVSPAAKKAAEDLEFKVVEDGYYHWNLRDQHPKETEFGDKIIIGHGHIQDGDGCFNGVCETSANILALPSDTEFYFLDEALK